MATYSAIDLKDRLSPFTSMQNHHNEVYVKEECGMFGTLKISASARCRGLHLLAVSSHDLHLHRFVTLYADSPGLSNGAIASLAFSWRKPCRRAPVRAQVAIAWSISLESRPNLSDIIVVRVLKKLVLNFRRHRAHRRHNNYRGFNGVIAAVISVQLAKEETISLEEPYRCL
ncbi:hypothetical protein BKA93DRAFT_746717 [Sparassis latifolia]